MSIMNKFYSWLDGLNESNKFLTFMLMTIGWLPFMFANSLVIWAIGYTWFSASVIFYTLLFLRN